MKHLAWVGLVSVVAAAAAIACGGAEPSDTLAGRTNTSPDSDAGASSTSSSGSTSSSSGSTSSSSGSTTSSGGTDGGNEASTATNAFTGAAAYTATTGRTTNKPGEHPNGGNPVKLACLSCHSAGNGAPPFFAGGTVFKDTAATMPASQIEVRFRDAAGKALSVYTDALGNFYVTQSAATNAGLAFPLSVGARDGTSTKPMVGAIANGDCNSSACHGGAQGFIHVP